MATKFTPTQIGRVISFHIADYLGVSRYELDADKKIDPNNPENVELRDTLLAIASDLQIDADEFAGMDFSKVTDLGELRVEFAEFLNGVKIDAQQPGYGTIDWAVQTLASFEYSSDGFIKRYPEQAHYEKAMKIITVARNVLSQPKKD